MGEGHPERFDARAAGMQQRSINIKQNQSNHPAKLRAIARKGNAPRGGKLTSNSPPGAYKADELQR